MAGVRSSFRLLEDKPCASEIRHMQWSPTMDLLAVVTEEGEIWLQRLSWQRVWTIPVNDRNACTCLAWRDDGKVLAAGFQDGSIKLFDVEDTELIHSCKLDSSIKCMQWIREKNSTEATTASHFYKDASEKFLPQLKDITSKAGSATFPKENPTSKKNPKRLKHQAKELSVLVVGDDAGNVHIFIHGIFHCVSLSGLKSVDSTGNASVLSASLSTDFKSLSAVIQTQANGTEQKNFTFLLYDTTLLSSRSEEIGILAYKYAQTVSLLEMFEETLQSMSEAWEEILLEIDSKLTKFSESTDPDKTVGDEFLMLFTCGIASPEMQHFLVHELTEKGLKKLGTSIDHSYTNIQNLTMKQLQGLEDALMFHLTDLLGMSCWYDKFGILGLTEAAMQRGVNNLGAFMLKTREMLQVIDSSTKSFKAFFKWIYIVLLRFLDEPIPNCIRQSSDKEVDLVLKFLEDHLMKKGQNSKFTVERVGQYLRDDDLKTTQDTSKTAMAELLNICPSLKTSPLIFPDHSHKSLKSSFKILSQSIKEAFEKPLAVIGQSVSCNGTIPLFVSVQCAPRITQQTLMPPLNHSLVFTDAQEASESLYILSTSTKPTHSNEPITMQFRKCHFQLPDTEHRLHISDVVVYTDHTLTVLFQNEHFRNNAESVLAQCPVRSITDLKYSEFSSSDPMPGASLVDMDRVSGSVNLWGAITHSRCLDGMQSKMVAVSGTRKVSAVLSQMCTRVRLFDMDAEDEEDDNETEVSMDESSSKGD